jgi:serpin B
MSLRYALVLSLPLTLACGDDGASQGDPDAGNDNFETNRSALERDLTPDVAPAAIEAVAAANRATTLAVFNQIAAVDANTVCSPFSMQQAFALLYAGARGTTATEIADVLGFVGEPADFHPAMNAIDLALASRNLDATATDDPVSLRVANSFWGQTGVEWKSDYLDLIALNYGAAIYGLDFPADPDAARGTINAWVAEQTVDRILNLLPQGSISAATVAVLTNAIYLKAPWSKAFDPDSTSDGAFTLTDDTTVTVPFMHQAETHLWADGDGWTALDMALRGDQLSVLFVVPDAGTFDTFADSLDAAKLDLIIESLDSTDVSVALPRFRVESSSRLRETLSALGMPTVFAGADLSGMTDLGGLYVSEAYHRAFVEVNEQGVEAAAATAIVVDRGGMGETFNANRPFYFIIRDRPTGIALFIGRVLNPSL